MRERVGREPEPTAVFCGALSPEGFEIVGEFEMIDIAIIL